MIAPDSTEILVAATGESGRNRTGIAAGFHRLRTPEFVRQNRSRGSGFNLEPRDKQDETKPRQNFEMLLPLPACNREAPKFGRGRIIGVPFEAGTKRKNLFATEWATAEHIKAMEDAKPHGYTAAQPSGNRNVALNRAGKRKGLSIGRLEKCAARRFGHGHGFNLSRAANGDKVIKPKRHPETVEAGSEIGSGRRNADRDLLLFQRKPLENAELEAAAAMILACAAAAARQR